jgi:iron complex outermembrane receptor protein
MILLRNRFLMFVALAVLLQAGPAASQPAPAADGRINGVVRDTTGAAVPGVAVTITNQATGAAQNVTAGTDGTFSVAVPPGTYTVTVSLRGFGRQTRRDLRVEAGATLPAEFSLEPQREEEVTVTAMLREQSVQDVPFSIAAPTEAEMRGRGIENLETLAVNIAGLSVQNLGPGQSQVAMRGVSAGQIVRDQPGVKEQVGAYLDDSIISLSLFTPDLDLFDVGRVEVLRGPQGTLFGAGSLSGTVRYISNQPVIGAREYFGEVGGSTVSGGSLGGNAKLGFNLPLGSTAAVRVAAYYNHLAGYIDAVQPDLSVKEDVNTGNRTGVRAAVKIAPNDRLSITPRLVYQRVDADGWNRVDAYNILGNPFTTSRPPVTLGERQQFTQIGEPFTDDFTLGDLNVRYDFGSVNLTSITSFTHRDVLVVRDATALTASITGGSIGLPPSIYNIGSPLDDATTSKVWTQEVRLAGGKSRFHWVGGAFYSHNKRDYGQSLLVAGFESASGIPTAGSFGAPRDVLFFSDLHYKLDQFALFGEATFAVSEALDITGGLRYYNFNEDRTQTFDGIFADPGTTQASTDANGVAPRLIFSYKATDGVRLNAQASKGFRLGGINDPLNVPLCTSADLVTFGGRDSWNDEKAWNYELGAKSRILKGRGSFNVALFDMEISDLQATVTAGSCSSRVIFNVPKARSRGVEVELTAAPDEHFDFSISGSFADAKLKSTLTSTSAAGAVSVVSGIQEGNRLPTVPEFQMAASATYQWQVAQGALGYVTGTFQHMGSRFTQIGDQAAGFGTVNLLAFAPNNIGGPLRASTFTFDPELPSYDLLNARVGVRRGRWDVALYGNNLTDERALLALDQERGTLARVSYLTNQPRTFGVTARFSF